MKTKKRQEAKHCQTSAAHVAGLLIQARVVLHGMCTHVMQVEPSSTTMRARGTSMQITDNNKRRPTVSSDILVSFGCRQYMAATARQVHTCKHKLAASNSHMPQGNRTDHKQDVYACVTAPNKPTPLLCSSDSVVFAHSLLFVLIAVATGLHPQLVKLCRPQGQQLQQLILNCQLHLLRHHQLLDLGLSPRAD
jgi:hypothetical protein